MTYSIEAFVDALLVEKGISDVEMEVREQLKNDLVDRAENIINAEILAHMPREELSVFEQLLDAGSDDEVQAFCKEKISNLAEVIAESLMKLRNTYLGINI